MMCVFSPKTVKASEIDMSYNGKIDANTGLEIGGDTEDSGIIRLNGNTSYDKHERLYLHIYGDDKSFYSNVVNGMITSEPVSIKLEMEGSDIALYKDGERQKDVNIEHITEPGNYYLSAEQSNQNNLLKFCIVEEVTGKISSYRMPEDFNIISAYHDGESTKWEKSNIDFKEGKYKIEYECVKTGVTYDLEVDIDYTAPTLLLDGMENGMAVGPVHITDQEEDSALIVYLNGEKISHGDMLTDSGDYQLVYIDKAGNISEYKFRILIYFNSYSWSFFAAIGISLVILIGYLLRERKKFRVR